MVIINDGFNLYRLWLAMAYNLSWLQDVTGDGYNL